MMTKARASATVTNIADEVYAIAKMPLPVSAAAALTGPKKSLNPQAALLHAVGGVPSQLETTASI